VAFLEDRPAAVQGVDTSAEEEPHGVEPLDGNSIRLCLELFDLISSCQSLGIRLEADEGTNRRAVPNERAVPYRVWGCRGVHGMLPTKMGINGALDIYF